VIEVPNSEPPKSSKKPISKVPSSKESKSSHFDEAIAEFNAHYKLTNPQADDTQEPMAVEMEA